jgi:hypothetical protein
MSVRGGYEFSRSETSGDFSAGSTGNLVWAAFARQIGPLARVGTSATYSLQSLDDSRVWNASLFATYELPGRLSFAGSLGYSALTSDAGDTSTIATNTTATYRSGNAFVSVGILQDLEPTFTQGENFGITLTRAYSGTAGYAWTPFIDTSVRAAYSDNEFTGVGNTGGTRKALSLQAAVVWRIRRWLTMTAEYQHNRYDGGDSTAPAGTAGTAVENRGTLSLAGSF